MARTKKQVLLQREEERRRIQQTQAARQHQRAEANRLASPKNAQARKAPPIEPIDGSTRDEYRQINLGRRLAMTWRLDRWHSLFPDLHRDEALQGRDRLDLEEDFFQYLERDN